MQLTKATGPAPCRFLDDFELEKHRNPYPDWYSEDGLDSDSNMESRTPQRPRLRVMTCEKIEDLRRHVTVGTYAVIRRIRREAYINLDAIFLEAVLTPRKIDLARLQLIALRKILHQLRTSPSFSRNLCAQRLEELSEIDQQLESPPEEQAGWQSMVRPIKKLVSRTRYVLASYLFQIMRINAVNFAISDFVGKEKDPSCSRVRHLHQQFSLTFLPWTQINPSLKGQITNIRLDFLSRMLTPSLIASIVKEITTMETGFMRDNVENWLKKIKEKIKNSKQSCKICAREIPTALMSIHSEFCLESYGLQQEILVVNKCIKGFLGDFKSQLRKLKLFQGYSRKSISKGSQNSHQTSEDNQDSPRMFNKLNSPEQNINLPTPRSKVYRKSTFQNSKLTKYAQKSSSRSEDQLPRELTPRESVQEGKYQGVFKMKDRLESRFRENLWLITANQYGRRKEWKRIRHFLEVPKPPLLQKLSYFAKQAPPSTFYEEFLESDNFRLETEDSSFPLKEGTSFGDDDDSNKYSLGSSSSHCSLNKESGVQRKEVSSYDQSEGKDSIVSSERLIKVEKSPNKKFPRKDGLGLSENCIEVMKNIDSHADGQEENEEEEDISPLLKQMTVRNYKGSIKMVVSPELNRMKQFRRFNSVFSGSNNNSESYKLISKDTFNSDKGVIDPEQYQELKHKFNLIIQVLSKSLQDSTNFGFQVKQIQSYIEQIDSLYKRSDEETDILVGKIKTKLEEKSSILLKLKILQQKMIEDKKNKGYTSINKVDIASQKQAIRNKFKNHKARSINFNETVDPLSSWNYNSKLKKLKSIEKVIDSEISDLVNLLYKHSNEYQKVKAPSIPKKYLKPEKISTFTKYIETSIPKTRKGDSTSHTEKEEAPGVELCDVDQDILLFSKQCFKRARTIPSDRLDGLLRRHGYSSAEFRASYTEFDDTKRRKLSQNGGSYGDLQFWSDEEEKPSKNPSKKLDKLNKMESYEFIKVISKGAYGVVWLVKRKLTGDYYAMKITDYAEKVKIIIHSTTIITTSNMIIYQNTSQPQDPQKPE